MIEIRQAWILIPNSCVYELQDFQKVIFKPQFLHLKNGSWGMGKQLKVDWLEPPKLNLIFFRLFPKQVLAGGNDFRVFPWRDSTMIRLSHDWGRGQNIGIGKKYWTWDNKNGVFTLPLVHWVNLCKTQPLWCTLRLFICPIYTYSINLHKSVASPNWLNEKMLSCKLLYARSYNLLHHHHHFFFPWRKWIFPSRAKVGPGGEFLLFLPSVQL